MQKRLPFLILAPIVGAAFCWGSWGLPWTGAQPSGSGAAASVLTFEPATLTVDQGATGSAKVTVVLRSGKAGGTTLSAWDVPNGVAIRFSPNTGNPTFTATMSVSVTTTTKSGTYMVKVQATGGDPSDVVAYPVIVQRTAGY